MNSYSKQLVANIYLQYYINDVIKNTVTCISFSFTTQMDSVLSLIVSLQSHALVSAVTSATVVAGSVCLTSQGHHKYLLPLTTE